MNAMAAATATNATISAGEVASSSSPARVATTLGSVLVDEAAGDVVIDNVVAGASAGGATEDAVNDCGSGGAQGSAPHGPCPAGTCPAGGHGVGPHGPCPATVSPGCGQGTAPQGPCCGTTVVCVTPADARGAESRPNAPSTARASDAVAKMAVTELTMTTARHRATCRQAMSQVCRRCCGHLRSEPVRTRCRRAKVEGLVGVARRVVQAPVPSVRRNMETSALRSPLMPKGGDVGAGGAPRRVLLHTRHAAPVPRNDL
jgi:hypothetical protein